MATGDFGDHVWRDSWVHAVYGVERLSWAEVNANLEASSLLTVSRIGAGLPSPEREVIHGLGMKYAEATINEDWPKMRMQQDSRASQLVEGEMWKVLAEVKSEGNGSNSADHLANALKDLSERRNLREQELRNRLPKILWLLLVAGAGATVGIFLSAGERQ
jgi:hypothetical protein